MCFRRNNILILLLFFSVAAGCAPLEYKKHPEFEKRSEKIKLLGLFPPDIKVIEFTAGGVQELRDDWSAQGKEKILSMLIEGLEKKGIQSEILSIGDDSKEEMEDILALYRAVSKSIDLHVYGSYVSPGIMSYFDYSMSKSIGLYAYGPYIFPEKKSNFNYSIGSIEKILKEYNSDALIIVYGKDEQSTKSRKVLQFTSSFISALMGVYAVQNQDITSVSIALVEPSGMILCYCSKSLFGGFSFTDTNSVSIFLDDIISSFPMRGLE
jgi:hypothetical protein